MSQNNVVALPAELTQSEALPAMQSEASSLVTMANTMIIASAEDFDKAAEKLRAIKDWKSKLEDEKERIYRPIKTGLDRVTALFKPPLADLELAEKTVRGKMATYDAAEKEKARRREEEERKAREEEALRVAKIREDALAEQTRQMKEEAARRAAEARTQGDELGAAAVEAQAAAGVEAMTQAHAMATDAHFDAASTINTIAKTTNTAGGAFTTRMVKKVRITNPALLPREFLMPDDAKIQQAALRDGVVIPGVEVYEEAVGSLRRAA